MARNKSPSLCKATRRAIILAPGPPGGAGLGILVRRSGAALRPLVPAGRPARRSQRIAGALI